MGYKDYQQVLNLTSTLTAKLATIKKSTTKKISPAPTTSIKKRTKTGCFTCRRRKKKCDMDKVDGKCQACIRNFLDCSWPEEHSHEDSISVTSSPEPVKCDSLKVEKVESKGAEAYPSPILSPRSAYHSEGEDFKSIQLPPLRNKNFKITKSKAEKSATPKSLNGVQTQFVITSFNSHKELCQLKN